MDQPGSLNQTLAVPFILTGTVLFAILCLKLLLFPNRGDPLDPLAEDDPALKKVVLSGPMGHGKTQLWSQLVFGTDRIETVTSMVENRRTLDLRLAGTAARDNPQAAAAVCVVDTPGHPCLSCRSLARNLPGARGVVFVIDGQLAPTGKGLRDISGALELVLSLLQLLYHRHPQSKLPRLSICISNPSPHNAPSAKPASATSNVIQKTRTSLTKELGRNKTPSATAAASEQLAFRRSRLESIEAIPSSEFDSLFDIIKQLFGFKKSNPLTTTTGQARSSSIQPLPEEQLEATRLLEEEEEDKLSSDDKLLGPLERYEKLSGHPIHWIASGQDQRVADLVKNWLVDL